MLTRLLASIGIAALIAGLAFWQGHRHGTAAEAARWEADRAALQRHLFDLGDELADKAQELEAARQEQEILAKEMEDAAFSDPSGARPGIGPDGMRRLERRWRAD